MARTRILTQLLFASICAAVATITGIPDQTSSTTTTYVYTAGPSQSAVSYSYTYTYTTATTHWHAPRFPRATPLPPCTNDICPSHNKKRCVDSEGAVYGVLCDALLSGTVITNSGKFVKRHEVKRSYTGTFEGCTAFCDTYNSTTCTGVAYEDGDCLAYNDITGNFPNTAGGFAALRLS